MLSIMDKVLGWTMVVMAIITLWSVLTDNHLFIN